MTATAVLKNWRFSNQARFVKVVERHLLTLPLTPEFPSIADYRQEIHKIGFALAHQEAQGIHYLAQPTEDRVAAQMWTGWLCGDPWAHREEWEKRYLPAAAAMFRRIPNIRAAQRDELHNVFFLKHLSPAVLPMWSELAVRVVQTQGMLNPLVACLDAAGIRWLASAIMKRRSMRPVIQSCWPETKNRDTLTWRLIRHLEQTGDLHTLLHVHIACRALDLFSTVGRAIQPLRNVLLQVISRARCRVRALAAEATLLHQADPLHSALGQHLLSLPGLHQRTYDSVYRCIVDWMSGQNGNDLSIDDQKVLTVPCKPPEEPPLLPEAVSEEWLTSALQRLGRDTLHSWAACLPAEGRRSGTLWRLLQDAPPHLCDRHLANRKLVYRRLRLAVDEALSEPAAKESDLLSIASMV